MLRGGGYIIYIYVYDVRTSQEAQAFTLSYGDSFTSLYADDGRTSQETPMGLHGLLRGWLYFHISR
jgi:hypothetical protein